MRRCDCSCDEVVFAEDPSGNGMSLIDFGFRAHRYRDGRTLKQVLHGVIREASSVGPE